MRLTASRVVIMGSAVAGVAVAAALPGLALRPTMVRLPGWNGAHTQFTLPNGWRVSPVGQAVTLPGDMPGNILVLPDGKRALVNTCGFHDHSLNLIDLTTGKVLDSVIMPRSWIGLALAGNGDVLVSGGHVGDAKARPAIHRFRLTGDKLTEVDGWTAPDIDPKQQFVSSILGTEKGLYVINVQTDEVRRVDAEGQTLAKVKVGYRPYAAALSPDGQTLAVSNWGDKSVILLDAERLEARAQIPVAAHPTALVYGPDGRLYVANAGNNVVTVLRDGKMSETIRTGVDQGIKVGSTPVALALSPDAKTLYVANAGNNCVSVVDVSRPGKARMTGMIPTERYPTAVTVTPDGGRLLIGTAKGFYGPNAGKGVTLSGAQIRGGDYNIPFRYIGQQLTGRLAILEIPKPAQLAAMTQQVLENRPVGLEAAPDAAERKQIEREAFRKIKHVIYVIRENRTFDQVLGDLPQVNGDPSLTLFGRRVTPNGHRLAQDFVTFDNFYADGEVSQAGHQWSDAAYANDYTEKAWVLSYSRHDEVESDPRLTSSPGEYLWSQARKHGKSARVYGEYVDVQEDHDSLSNVEVKKDPEKYGYSARFEEIFARGGRDTEKVAEFVREMRLAERTGKWPNLMVMALPEDHTHGLSAGALSPYAMVGSNDLAIGQLVEAVSHSKFWESTAIFIIQDDAQDGPDHVDSHRTVALAISPYTRRRAVDSTMYSTSSMLRTMELILGIPPMTQFDASATPMYAAFTTTPDLRPYTALPPGVDLNERNPKGTALARRSDRLDWSEVDRADWGELNRILWEKYRPGVPYPRTQ